MEEDMSELQRVHKFIGGPLHGEECTLESLLNYTPVGETSALLLGAEQNNKRYNIIYPEVGSTYVLTYYKSNKEEQLIFSHRVLHEDYMDSTSPYQLIGGPLDGQILSPEYLYGEHSILKGGIFSIVTDPLKPVVCAYIIDARNKQCIFYNYIDLKAQSIEGRLLY